MDGVLVIDKPAGITSHDVVARVRRALGITRIGHTGTLDPMATGVLPLVVGRATRLARYLSASDKAYDATIRLGFATTTYDAQGEALGAGRWAPGEDNDQAVGGGRWAPDDEPALGTGHSALGKDGGGRRSVGADGVPPAVHSPDDVRAALDRFLGTHLQRPPAFSAKKVGGVPAYKRARREQPVDLPPVEVTLYSLDDVEVEGELVRLRLVCSAGYYVRSLAHDLGEALGCGAHLAALRRTRSGDFTLVQAVTLEDVSGPAEAGPCDGAPDGIGRRGRLQPARESAQCLGRGSATREGGPVPNAECRRGFIPVESLIPWAPWVTLTEEGETRVRHGRSIEEAHITQWGEAAQPGPVSSAECPAPSAQRPAAPVVRVFAPDGRLVALATPTPAGRWPLHPGVVFGFE